MAMEQEQGEGQSQLRFTEMPRASLARSLPHVSGWMLAASPCRNMALSTG